MICTVCGVWYDLHRGCDHRVIAMNKEIGYVLAKNEESE